MTHNPYRCLPAVKEVLDQIQASFPAESITTAVRAELDRLRKRLKKGEVVDGATSVASIAAVAVAQLEREARPHLRRVINATGIVLHTNLGRAPVAEGAARAAYEAGRGYLNLELDLDSGNRSSRQDAVRDVICRLTGAESATVVNNNAAATIIAVRALCQGKEVIVSRGQLVEIGGSFRIPEIIAVSGATLREVGTTNITRLSDYENAIGPNTGALMRIHTSNYQISGFTKSVDIADLVSLSHKHGLPVIDDVGSGALIDFARFGFVSEPMPRASIAAGAELVLFSGDKLLGGPQAGIIAGRDHWIKKIEQDPLMRAVRMDKMTLAALEATLRIYLNGEQARRDLPVLRMLETPLSELQLRAEALAMRINNGNQFTATARTDVAFVGGGSLPGQSLATWVVEVSSSTINEETLARHLRQGNPAVLARCHAGYVLLDVRTIFPEQEHELIAALGAISARLPARG